MKLIANIKAILNQRTLNRLIHQLTVEENERLRKDRDVYYFKNETLGRQVAELNRKIKALESKTSYLRKSETEDKSYSLMREFGSLFVKPTDELKKAASVDIYYCEDSEKWTAVTGYCQLGGCNMGELEFECERDAYLFAALMGVIEYKPHTGSACPSCYHEYMQDCI